MIRAMIRQLPEHKGEVIIGEFPAYPAYRQAGGWQASNTIKKQIFVKR